VSQAPLDNTQLALLQQLTQTVKHGNGVPSQPASAPPPMLPPPHLNHAFSEAIGRSQSPSHYHGSGHREVRYDRYNSPEERGRGRDDFHDDRVSSRGGFRGGFRGRGRGEGRGRWDDHDHFRDRDRSPLFRARRSRSRSPPSRYGGRRDIKPYSPPRRPSAVTMTAVEQTRSAESVPGSREVEKDEFGRDIRPPSPKGAESAHDLRTQPQPPILATSVDPTTSLPSNQISLSPVAASTSSQTPDARFSNANLSQQGLDKFEIAAFDPTAPVSWEALGKMWQVTHGYIPSQEALLQFLSRGMTDTTLPTQSNSEQGWAGSHSDPGAQMWRGRGRGGYSGGRGSGLGKSSTRDSKEKWSYEQESDAIVLGGDTGRYAGNGNGDVQMSTEDGTQIARPGISEASAGSNVVGAGGRMQRVGDKWVFVRDPAI